MYLEQGDLNGNPFVGIFAVTNDSTTFLPPDADKRFEKIVGTVLKTKVVKGIVCNSPLLGVFSCMNSTGVVLPETVYRDEVEFFKKHFEQVGVITGYTAIGNLLTCNDKGCVVSPLFSRKAIKVIGQTLGVKCTVMRLAGLDTTGSSVIATNKGLLTNPNITEKEMAKLEEVLQVKGGAGTLNYGNPFVKAGILGNSAGAIVGSTTTPFEMGQLDEALFFKKE